MAIVIVRDSDRGANDYKQGDIVDVFEDPENACLPPKPPFWCIKITGATKADLVPYIQSEYSGTTPTGAPIMSKRRLWGLKTGAITPGVGNYLLAHRFVGFGSAEDQAKYGALVAGDYVLQWTDVQDWIVNKNTSRNINGKRV